MPSELWRRWRLWKISRYSRIALASSTRVLQRRRFDSPHLLHRKGQAKPGILRAPGGHQGAVRVFSTRYQRRSGAGPADVVRGHRPGALRQGRASALRADVPVECGYSKYQPAGPAPHDLHHLRARSGHPPASPGSDVRRRRPRRPAAILTLALPVHAQPARKSPRRRHQLHLTQTCAVSMIAVQSACNYQGVRRSIAVPNEYPARRSPNYGLRCYDTKRLPRQSHKSPATLNVFHPDLGVPSHMA
jgi:hypothetical protein